MTSLISPKQSAISASKAKRHNSLFFALCTKVSTREYLIVSCIFSLVYRHQVIRDGYKAGNLKSAMNCSYVKYYEYVVIFDADFQPQADFLKHAMPHFKKCLCGPAAGSHGLGDPRTCSCSLSHSCVCTLQQHLIFSLSHERCVSIEPTLS